MPRSIRAKLFLTLLVAAVLAVTATQAFVHWSFLRNLRDLAEARQQERIDEIAERLVARYAQDQGWRPLQRDKRLWLEALFGAGGWRHQLHDGAGRGPPHRLPPRVWRVLLAQEQWPPKVARRDDAPVDVSVDARGDMPGHALGDVSLDAPAHPPSDRPDDAWGGTPGDTSGTSRADGPPGRRPAPGSHPMPLPFRLMLLDADDAILYGRPELLGATTRYPLTLDGERIGTLALLPGPTLSDAAQRRFRNRQGSQIWIIALGMVGLAALLAMPAAALLTRPVRALQQTARRLARGDYQARAPTPTRDELGRLAEDLNDLATTLARNEDARRRWVSDIAHELRTPLSLLRADIEAMQDGVRPTDSAALAGLHEAVLRIGRLVEDLNELTLTEPGTRAYQRRPTDVAALVAETVADARERFAEQGLRLSVERIGNGPSVLDADPDRLGQLLQNLLENSRAYTDPRPDPKHDPGPDPRQDPGQPVRVRIDCQPERLLIAIDDGPPGVPDSALPHLFERLYRVDASRNRRSGGAGLGLAIARNIVEAHGGTITAEHSPLGGLGIRISLPVADPAKPSETTNR